MSMNINAKTLEKNSMSGNIFKAFLLELVDSFNQSDTPLIMEIGKGLFQNEAKSILDETL